MGGDMSHAQKAAEARLLNVIDMAVGFTAMMRVFEKGSGRTIKKMV